MNSLTVIFSSPFQQQTFSFHMATLNRLLYYLLLREIFKITIGWAVLFFQCPEGHSSEQTGCQTIVPCNIRRRICTFQLFRGFPLKICWMFSLPSYCFCFYCLCCCCYSFTVITLYANQFIVIRQKKYPNIYV